MINNLLQSFEKELRDNNKSYKTVHARMKSLQEHVLPYFGDDVTTWPTKSPKFLPVLKQQGVSQPLQLHANTALKLFWQFLAFEGVVPATGLLLRKPQVAAQATPLPHTVTPEDVLSWVKRQTNQEVQLAALLGYFFSLRPQEVFALRPCDFVAGQAAADTDAGKAMEGSRLVVYVDKQRTAKGLTPPKAHSVGFVACFNQEAAEILVGILNTLPPRDRIFGQHIDTHYGRWEKFGIPGITLKSLRRSSLYWLGHFSSVAAKLPVIRNHARHKKADTTLGYLRRPAAVLESQGGQLQL